MSGRTYVRTETHEFPSSDGGNENHVLVNSTQFQAFFTALQNGRPDSRRDERRMMTMRRTRYCWCVVSAAAVGGEVMKYCCRGGKRQADGGDRPLGRRSILIVHRVVANKFV